MRVRERSVTIPGEYQIIRYLPEYRGQVAELQKGMWSPYLRLNEAYLEWKHLWNPYTREPLIYLAVARGQVVGMRGFFGARWFVGTPPRPVLLPCAGDLIIAQEHRNRGLVAEIMKFALADLALRGFDYTISLSAGSVTLLSQIATGWRSIGSLRVLERAAASPARTSALRVMANRWPLVAGLYRQLRDTAKAKDPRNRKSPSPRQFECLDQMNARLGRRLNGCITIEPRARPQEMAELVARLVSDTRIRHVQDEEYFEWRFRNPLSHYRFLFWCEPRLEGFLVLRASVVPWRSEVGIIAWQASSAEVRSALICAAVRLMGRRTLRVWSATLADPEREALVAEGFRPVSQRITENPRMALIRSTREERVHRDWLVDGWPVLNISSWDLSMICSDGV
ncbi:MAG: hypothetical protein EPO25_16235 [Gammaproteobacteria bacterium]|nr:MAG: hypothetical protein EPO25_16235 [Gammaproteobacteria bacterium]